MIRSYPVGAAQRIDEFLAFGHELFFQEMEPTYSVTVDDIKCSYFDQVERLRDFGSRNKETVAQLVWGFFNYWAYCHDYTNSVVSVRSGCLLR